jgi:PPM family protein phosphatase
VTRLRVGSATDTGQVRSKNEDAALIGDAVFAVADGMGGHAAGDVASQVALEAFDSSTSGGVDDEEDVVEAVRAANQAVLDRADDEPELAGMGTTLTALALVPGPEDGSRPGELVIANVGDSRAYLFRDGDLTQLTRDHSLVEDLVQEGRLSPEEARSHPQRNILTRVLGNDPDVEPDVFRADPVRGDRYLLCSDGLSNEVDEERTASVLRRLADPDDAARELVRLANENGGRDNITVVVVDVVDDDDRAGAASRLLGRSRRSSDAGGAAGAQTAVLERTETQPERRGPPRRADARAARAERRATRKAVRKARPRRLTFRSLLFVILVLAVAGAAAGAVWWFARNTFYVGVAGEEVVIYRGRPGGVLWIEPTIEQHTNLLLAQVPAERRQDVEDGRTEPTLEDARDYVRALRARTRELEQQKAQRDAAKRAISTTSTTAGGGG